MGVASPVDDFTNGISLPEIDPEFDDSSFVTADQTTTNVSGLALI
jgi:hypothetical protein